MILHPGALALTVGSAVVLALLVVASWISVSVLVRWNPASSSPRQLTLERRTHLVSTIAAAALAFEVVSTLLFLYTLDDIHRLFVGAMCAIGSLNANPVGWAVLLVKIAILFAAPLWIVVNRLDQQAGDFPVVRSKSAWLLLLTPLVAVDLVLQVWYFAGLDPEVITSCCGALFTPSGTGVASDLAALPPFPTMAAFFATGAAFLGLIGVCAWRPSTAARLALSAASVVFLLVALASIVSFLAPYAYELPTHHCPFDLIQRSSSFVGYPIFAAVYLAVLFGILPGATVGTRRHPTLRKLLEAAEPRWLRLSAVSTVALIVITTVQVVSSGLSMRGY